MMKGVYFFVQVILLLCLGMACTGPDAGKTLVTVERLTGGEAYFQPEDSSGYIRLEKDSLGQCVLKLELNRPGYYRYVDRNMKFYTLLLVPRARVVITEEESGVTFGGDYAAENRFINENRFTGVYDSLTPYSAEWIAENERTLEQVLGKLQASGLDPDFIRQQTLYYRFANYRHLARVKNGTNPRDSSVQTAPHFYDFLKECTFDDPWVMNIPKWSSTMRACFECMEREGRIEASPENFMQVYAARITDARLRSFFLAELLDWVLLKGYWTDFPAWLEGVRPLVTDPEALARLPAIGEKYRSLSDKNKNMARGCRAPEWKAWDRTGKEYSSADFAGKVLVLDFWFTGCIPCRAAMPYMDRLADKMKGKPVVFVTISLDSKPELIALWKKMVGEPEGPVLHLNIPEGFRSELVEFYKVGGVPRVVIVDREGRIADPCAPTPVDPKLELKLENLLSYRYIR